MSRETLLDLVLVEGQSCLLKEFLVLEISPHDAKVLRVNKFIILLHVLFYEDKASLAIFSSKVFSSFDQELDQILISQIAKAPLYPDTVVFALEGELLQPLFIELTYLGQIFPCFVDLNLGWLH